MYPAMIRNTYTKFETEPFPRIRLWATRGGSTASRCNNYDREEPKNRVTDLSDSSSSDSNSTVGKPSCDSRATDAPRSAAARPS
jgi:hypothetical protein